LSTTTVWSVKNRFASASKRRTPVNATGPAGTVTRALTNPGACAASALACASSILDCSPAYESGSHARPNDTPKNLSFESAQIGSGDVLTPVIAQSVMVCRPAPAPTSRSTNLAARALPPGRRSSDLSGLASSASRNHAVVSIGPPCDT
jgi:hypothetical protein